MGNHDAVQQREEFLVGFKGRVDIPAKSPSSLAHLPPLASIPSSVHVLHAVGTRTHWTERVAVPCTGEKTGETQAKESRHVATQLIMV